MLKGKIRLLFDAEQLALGAENGYCRSGIFFTALNLLKCFKKRENLEISLYVSKEKKEDVLAVLNKEFPNEKFDIFVCWNSKLNNRFSLLWHAIKDEKGFFTKSLAKILKYNKYHNYDAVFSSSYAIPDIVKDLSPKNSYIFLHDVIPRVLKEYSDGLAPGSWFEKLTSNLNGEDYYFTNSEYTRQDFLKFYPKINPEKIITTYVGCNVPFTPQYEKINSVKEKYNIPKDKKYLFSLSSKEPRKNLIRTVQTFIRFIRKHNIDDLIYVMGGSNWKSFHEVMNSTISDLNTDKIFQIGYVDDEDLPVLYSGAEWFTYTSQYEGFGSPVLEAMNCGCPVITSNNSSLPEVIGDAGIKVSWDSDEEHIEAYEKYYFNDELREENSKKGIERAKMFSWEKTAGKILEVIFNNRRSH